MRPNTKCREAPTAWRGAGTVTRYPSLQWAPKSHDAINDGWLITRTTQGFAMVTPHALAPDCGESIRVVFLAGNCGSFLMARIVRIEPLSDVLDLVSAEFSPHEKAEAFSEKVRLA
jgi:hypothetical protein